MTVNSRRGPEKARVVLGGVHVVDDPGVAGLDVLDRDRPDDRFRAGGGIGPAQRVEQFPLEDDGVSVAALVNRANDRRGGDGGALQQNPYGGGPR